MAKELAKQYDPKGTEDRIYQEWCDKAISTPRSTAAKSRSPS